MTKNKPDPDPNPGPDEFDGDGDSFHAALDAAWGEAKRKGKSAGWFEVKKTWVFGENPIGEYKVRIKG